MHLYLIHFLPFVEKYVYVWRPDGPTGSALDWDQVVVKHFRLQAHPECGNTKGGDSEEDERSERQICTKILETLFIAF